MSNPWPERKIFGAENAAIGDTVRIESDATYLIRMVQQLFVDLAELRVAKTPIAARPSTYVGGAAPLVPRTVTLSLAAEDWDEISRISWKRLVNDEILLSLMVASRLAGDRAEAR